MKFAVNLGGETEPLEGETHPAGLYADKSLTPSIQCSWMNDTE